MKYAHFYERISKPFRTPGAQRALRFADKALVYGFAAAFVVLVIYVAISAPDKLIKTICVPAAVFVLVTIVRKLINRPRPYEAQNIDPLIKKDTRGLSLPSRHMASATIIACAAFWVCMPVGIALFVCCAAIAFLRIVGGVHYPSDILAAGILALLCGFIGFYLIP